MNLTIKSIPEDVGAALRQAAARSGRSLNREIIFRLGVSLTEDLCSAGSASLVAESPDTVADAWESLAGRWKTDLSVEAEIAALYEARSTGRDIDLTW